MHIIRKVLKNQDIFLEQLFNAIDVESNGRIDFRDFLYAIGLLKSGNQDERLKFAFSAYDIDHDNYIDKEELVLLIKSNYKFNCQQISSIELSKLAEEIMLKYDINRDNHLSFSEFRYAVLEGHLLIHPIWLNKRFLFEKTDLNENAMFFSGKRCINCNKLFIPIRTMLNAVQCPDCISGKYLIAH